jgi:1-aminocyclopropane-1-carboxylate deaminase
MLAYYPTPVQEIHDPLFEQAGVKVLVRREDLNHPLVSGNKWWKLKYNLEEALRQGKKTLLTFGGAYSNHIYATAAAASELGFESIGVIRGEETLPLNATLRFANSLGMRLHYITREAYRHKHEDTFIEELHERYGDFYLIPEGGTNALAVKGVEEFARALGHDFDYLGCAVGTGGTLAGLINGLPDRVQLLGFPVLKGGEFLADEIRPYVHPHKNNWTLLPEYHFGGYAKHTPQLLAFIENFNTKNNFAIEFVYTGKLFAGVYELLAKGFFRNGSTILLIHTGGLQNIHAS